MRTIALFLLAACGHAATSTPDAGPPCNPIIGDDCLTPFPSSFFEVADPSTATGARVALDPRTLPVSRSKKTLDVSRWNRRDGFSPETPFLVYFKEGVDTTGLPDQSNEGLTASIDPASPVQILDAETGERVPLFVELDANAMPWDKQALIIRPMVRLHPKTRYLIALVGLKDRTGAPIVPRHSDDAILRQLESFGVARASVTVAWDVTIGSEEQARAHLEQMVGDSLEMTSSSLGYAITTTTDATSGDGLREVLATVQVPSYLASDDPTARLNVDADGKPTVRGIVDVPITIEIPRCAATAGSPIPFLVFGHGIFLDALGQLRTPFFLSMANTLCMAFVGTDWKGLASDDVASLSSLATDWNDSFFVTDHLQQAHVDFQVMTHLFATKIAADPALGGYVDGTHAYYFGISDGGIQGVAFLALSPEVTRASLDVPGADWNLMMFRSTDFKQILPLITLVYPEALDRQVLVALTQFEWDYTDPMTWADRLGTKQLTLMESIGDAQVPNLATRLLARTIGLGALPLVQPVYGIIENPGPLPSAYTQWDTHLLPLPPTTNTPAPTDNYAHEAVLGYPQPMEQIRRFLTPTGMVEDTCGGPCSL